MFEEYEAVRRVRRFRRDVSLIKKGNVCIYVLEEERFCDLYEKLYSMVVKLAPAVSLDIQLTYVGDDYVSFVCIGDGESFSLNYSLETSSFERDRAVLKHLGINKKRISCAIKNNGEIYHRRESCVYIIPGGVGVLCGKEGRKTVKIRKI